MRRATLRVHLGYAAGVDDEPQLVRVLRVHLEARGYQVDAAPDGRSALELAAQSLPDVVVLDLGLRQVWATASSQCLRPLRGECE